MDKEPKTIEEIKLRLAYLEGQKAGMKQGYEDAKAIYEKLSPKAKK